MLSGPATRVGGHTVVAEEHPERMILVNLPVTDLADAFYGALGFRRNDQFSDDRAVSYGIEENIVVMLLSRQRFADFVAGEVGDPAQATSALIALSAGSRAEVDSWCPRPSGRAASRGCRSRTTAPCTAPASPTPTATSGKSCGWIFGRPGLTLPVRARLS